MGENDNYPQRKLAFGRIKSQLCSHCIYRQRVTIVIKFDKAKLDYNCNSNAN
jgi:hypothetical protein